MPDDPPRKRIPMPRFRYIGDDGQPFDPIYGAYRHWPRELKLRHDEYCAYLDRMWDRERKAGGEQVILANQTGASIEVEADQDACNGVGKVVMAAWAMVYAVLARARHASL